jgi:LPXTG-motif cell wall-anchored protein
MYGTGVSAAAGVGTVGAGTLAYTGFENTWMVVAGVTLLAAGFAINRIIPRRQY